MSKFTKLFSSNFPHENRCNGLGTAVEMAGFRGLQQSPKKAPSGTNHKTNRNFCQGQRKFQVLLES